MSTGAVVVTNATLDFEVFAWYLLTVQTMDDSGASNQKTMNITVVNTNDAPTGVRLTVAGGALLATIDENIVRGTNISFLQAVDQVRVQ